MGASPAKTSETFSKPFQGQLFRIQREEKFGVDIVGG